MAAEGRRILVLGGARSGKSAHAEQRAASHDGSLVYIATAQALDDEMTERIAQHQARRGTEWRTIDAPIDLCSSVREVAATQTLVLVDCITLWITNLMLAERDAGAEVDRLCATLADIDGTIVLVSNEVGLGIVPDNALARRFRDVAGRANQRLAQVCDEVVLVTAGLPLTLKAP